MERGAPGRPKAKTGCGTALGSLLECDMTLSFVANQASGYAYMHADMQAYLCTYGTSYMEELALQVWQDSLLPDARFGCSGSPHELDCSRMSAPMHPTQPTTAWDVLLNILCLGREKVRSRYPRVVWGFGLPLESTLNQGPAVDSGPNLVEHCQNVSNIRRYSHAGI